MRRVLSAFLIVACALAANCGGYLDRECKTANEFCDGASRLSLLWLLFQPYTKFLVSASSGSSSLSVFSVSRNTGELRQISETGTLTPAAAAYRSAGSILVVADQGNNAISSYTLDLATGQLTAVQSLTIVNAAFLTFDPLGRYVYVSAGGSNNVTTVSVSSSGALKVDSIAGTVGAIPSGLIADPAGRFLFVGFSGSSTVASYLVSSTGALSEIGSVPGCAGGNLNAVSPDGRYLYVSCAAANNVMIYSIGSNGALTANGTAVASVTPKQIAVSPSGDTVLVAQTGLGIFRAAAGSLSLVTTVLGSQRTGTALDSSGQFVWSSRNGAIDTGTIAGQSFTHVQTLAASTSAGMLLPINSY